MANPYPPIEAYCLPFADRGGGTGCLLKVAYAEPGAEVEFVLDTPVGERANPTVALGKGQTMGGYKFYLKNSKMFQANLTGYVQYLGRPCYTWTAGSKDPTAQTWLHSRSNPLPFSKQHAPDTTYIMTVPMGGDSEITIFTFYQGVDPPPPPSPPEKICQCWDPNSPLPPSPPPPSPPPPPPPPPRSEDCCHRKTEMFLRPNGVFHKAETCFRCCDA